MKDNHAREMINIAFERIDRLNKQRIETENEILEELRKTSTDLTLLFQKLGYMVRVKPEKREIVNTCDKEAE
jgi:hypothetical protein